MFATTCLWKAELSAPLGVLCRQMACEKPDCTVPAVGQLPATLANLTALHTLNLADNAFHGPMPPDFGASAAAFPGLLSLCVSHWKRRMHCCSRLHALLVFWPWVCGTAKRPWDEQQCAHQALLALLRPLKACERPRAGSSRGTT